MWHLLTSIHAREWYLAQEIAAQKAGFAPHPYWGKLTEPDKHPPIAVYEDILASKTPKRLADALAEEHAEGGRLGLETIKDVLAEATPYAHTIRNLAANLERIPETKAHVPTPMLRTLQLLTGL